MQQYQWDEVRRRCHDLLCSAIAQVCDLTQMPARYPLDSDLFAQMGIAPLPVDVDLIDLTARGEGFETVDGFKKRTPAEWQLDVQASYSLNLAGNRRLTLLADAFNIFNLRRPFDYNAAYEEEFQSLNPDFGTVTSDNVAGQMYQTPFQLRFGARFGF